MSRFHPFVTTLILIVCSMLLQLNVPTYATSYGPHCDFDYAPYLHRVVSRVKDHWRASKQERKLRVAVQFKILPDGHVEDVQIQSPSGNERADRAALRAVKISAPLPSTSDSRRRR